MARPLPAGPLGRSPQGFFILGVDRRGDGDPCAENSLLSFSLHLHLPTSFLSLYCHTLVTVVCFVVRKKQYPIERLPGGRQPDTNSPYLSSQQLTTKGAGSRLLIMIGNRYGKLIVVAKIASVGKGVRWRADCECGGYWEGPGTRLRSGGVTSCGCIRKAKSVKPGDRFERLTVTQVVGPSAQGNIVKAVCDCGKVWQGLGRRLTIGNVRSCGCLRRESAGALGRAGAGRSKTGEPSKMSLLTEASVVGRLLLLGPAKAVNADSKQVWMCQCTCGNLCAIPAPALAYGRSKSCGCRRVKYVEDEAQHFQRKLEAAVETFEERVVSQQGKLADLLDELGLTEQPWDEMLMRKARKEQSEDCG